MKLESVLFVEKNSVSTNIGKPKHVLGHAQVS